MGGLRAAVGVVLGVISLAVLSLHIALCIHYPSPLFAVTLLLNPSLWLFLGLIGMGCALLLTHRDQQRKVRAGHCASCHPHYGSTIDTKMRGQDTKWRQVPHCQRGPSRAIYSYNGNLHKFYASYGTINEKQVIEMKHSSVKTPLSSNSNEAIAQCPSEDTSGTTDTQNGVECPSGDHGEKDVTLNSADELKVSNKNDNIQSEVQRDSDTIDEKVTSQKNGHLPKNDDNDQSNSVSSKSNGDKVSSKDNQSGNEDNLRNGIAKTATNSADTNAEHVPLRPSLQELLYRERRYCDCMARYGAVYHYSHLPRSAVSPRCTRYGMHDRALGRYNRKLMMRCKLKPPNDVPVELFAAKGTSANTSKETDKNHNCEDVQSEGSSDMEKATNHQNITSESQNPSQISEEASSAGCTDSTSLSSAAELSAPKESSNQSLHTTISSSFIVPLKHMSRFFTQTSLPLGSPYNGKSKQADHVEDQESTSLSSDQTASELELRDREDVVSISSKSSLLPSSPEKSMTNRDLTRSPLWRPFKSSIIGRKKFSDEERSSNDENCKGQQCKDYASGQDSANEDNQESPSSSLKSVFTNKRTFSKSPGEGRKISIFNQSNSNENVSSASTSSSASPNLKEKRRQQSDSSRSTKSKTSFSRKISSSKSQSLQKNSKTLLLSPARAVRSLVFRNAQKRSSRIRKAPDDKTQHGDFTPAKLPLLLSPNADPSPLESNITTAKPSPTEDFRDLSASVRPPTSTSAANMSTVSPSNNVLQPVSTQCSTSPASPCTSSLIYQTSSVVSATKSSNLSPAPAWPHSQAGDSTKEQPLSSSHYASTEPTARTPLISSPAISSTSSVAAAAAAVAAAATTTMASSSSPCGSPSVRPKEPKKPKIRLKGKHRSRAAESVMLLTADSDD